MEKGFGVGVAIGIIIENMIAALSYRDPIPIPIPTPMDHPEGRLALKEDGH